ncbi:MAG: AgmX/PglI C-terminal domain-containing protein [Halobacteriovoraceae bacterium]|nr:AgmX/PglI C-terminal domain-containing protein [Halobacteriovoraceae bacterium]MCB9093570.1 AgmX/PglI C-terminal domain-containing protein [Halobacteriovoraceae bacterium]
MIAISTENGEFIKNIRNNKSGTYGFHQFFGLISEESYNKRLNTNKRKGLTHHVRSLWHCSFKLEKLNNGFGIKNPENCTAKNIDGKKWQLNTPIGNFVLAPATNVDHVHTPGYEIEENNDALKRSLFYPVLFAILFFSWLYIQPEEEIEEEEKVVEPVAVRVIQQVQSVNITQEQPTSVKAKPLTEQQKANRSIQQNLGFLKLVGNKNLKNVTGGVTTKLTKATAGAGPGGDAGSGGEVLVGLGKGLKKTTVGNTGVAGLGGIGTKGAGGGKGGYGNTLVASGNGKGISAIAVSQDMVLDGGLSRYAIQATIAKYLNQIRRCYESQLQKIPGLEGLVTMDFVINGNGRLNFARVAKSSLGNRTVEGCMANRMMTWEFPKPQGGVDVKVNYPFMLRPVNL